MLNFKTFKFVYSLNEELTPEQEAEVTKKWPRGKKAVAATDHYFGKGNDVITNQLEGTQDKSEIHKAVEGHLGHEIHPDDYKQGHTTDKYGRKVKIGSLLQKSKAPKELVNGFANDSTRQGKKFTGLNVKVSRRPGDVAGQTSRGQSWENQSCKNYETGCNRHYLPHEVKHGTVVVYLHDHEGRHVLARSTLQPHHNDEGNVAYAVDSHYGIDHAGFRAHVEEVAKQLSGEHKGGSIVYKKHPKVYDDSGVQEMVHPNATKEHLDNALNDENSRIRAAAAAHPNATKEHLDKALNDSDRYVRRNAAKNKNATKEHLDKALEDEDSMIRASAVMNPNATKEHLDKASKDKEYYIRARMLQHPNVTKEQVNKASNDKHGEVRAAAAIHPHATSDHITKALQDSDEHVRRNAAKNLNATQDHITKALQDSNAYVRSVAAEHKNATEEHLHKALQDRETMVRSRAAKNPNANADHLNKALADKEWGVRYNAINNRNANAEHVHKAFSDEHYAVVDAAANHHLATKEDLEEARFDQDHRVRESAERRLKEMSQSSASK